MPRNTIQELQQKSKKLLRGAGYRCLTLPAAEIFNVIGIGPADIVLIHIAIREPDVERLKAIKLFPAPRNARKLVHRWRNYARTPEVREVR